ncbi:MAG: cytochrome c oxidase subunit II [Gaiellaceae bacterium]
MARLLATVATVLAALAVPAAALGGATGLGPVDPAGAGAEGIADLYWFIMVFAAIVFLVVTVPLVVFIVRYRNGGRARDAEGPQIHGSTRLELAWTIAPVLILVAVASFTFYKLGGITDPAAAGQPRGAVAVEGRQFYWQFEYPNGVLAVNKLRLPLGRVTTLTITAPAGDVIHSFWVPALAGKRDAIPGKPTSMKVRPDRLGRFRIVCGEFCGLQHAQMYGSVEVLPAEEFDGWLEDEAQRQQATPQQLGEEIFAGACAICHGVAGEALIGPALAGNPIVAQDDAVESVVREGRGEMPAVGQGWSDAELNALTRYLEQRFGPEGGSDGSSG